MARKVIASAFYSVNGVAEDPFNFQYDSFDKDLEDHMNQALGNVDAVILGRKLYEQWSQYWTQPDVGDDFGEFINPVAKYVASTTLKGNLEWNNSQVIDGDVETFVKELKQQDGKDIAVCGGLDTWKRLFSAGAIDELTLIVHPALAGKGRPLFENPQDQRLELVDCKRTTAGNALLTYGLKQ